MTVALGIVQGQQTFAVRGKPVNFFGSVSHPVSLQKFHSKGTDKAEFGPAGMREAEFQKFYLWALTFAFHIVFTCDEMFF